MNKDFIEKMEKLLYSNKKEIIEELTKSSKEFEELVAGMDPKDVADVASDDIDRKMLEAKGSAALKKLKLIESAIARIKQGKYGLCIKCGAQISEERLQAIPYALQCIQCKAADEKRNR
ncbi:MAG: TraR/DksA family transcriptional regulator [Spirochaetaceae bacterium]|jgi:RNA polymerase-binding protein DksA|nr:TraR/DksA family transcriptional regulator [Spirochaetaceae bacterium]